MPTDTDTEQDRVIFIKSVAQFMVTLFFFLFYMVNFYLFAYTGIL